MKQSQHELLKPLIKFQDENHKSKPIHACTDITGYGLLGHLLEICLGSDLSAEIYYNDIPFIDSAKELAQDNIIPGGTRKNLSYVEESIQFADSILDYQKLMIADAQTSGGLLISIPEKDSQKFIEKLKNEGCLSYNIIGTIKNKKHKSIYVI